MKTATSKFNVLNTKVALFTIALAVSMPAEAGIRYMREGGGGPEQGEGPIGRIIEWVGVFLSGVLSITGG